MSKEHTQEYRGNGKHEFEFVLEDATTFTQRLRVPGGWLYQISTDLGALGEGQPEFYVNTVFVPMPEVVKHKV